jgi:hypothetical protein
MRKFVCALMALILALALFTACGKQDDTQGTKPIEPNEGLPIEEVEVRIRKPRIQPRRNRQRLTEQRRRLTLPPEPHNRQSPPRPATRR